MDDAHEWKRRAGVIPAMLVLALAFHGCDAGHFVQRTALTMPLHELGHAVAGWFSGFAAIPTLWKTLIPEARSTLVPLVIGAAGAAALWRGWSVGPAWLLGAGIAVGALLFAGTFASSVDTARTVFTFAGDAGAMVLGTGLMLTFFVGPDSRLRTGGLRYGLAGIGAAALVDTFSVWWAARTDRSVIPFGEIEGVGLSDPSKLVDGGWTVDQLVDRYVLVGCLCFMVLAVVWARATWRERARVLG